MTDWNYDNILRMDWEKYTPKILLAGDYSSTAAYTLANKIVAMQAGNGGWGIPGAPDGRTTYNDHNTLTQLLFLLKMIEHAKGSLDDKRRWMHAAHKALGYIFDSQTRRGGWAVDYPEPRSDFGHTITFADWVVPEIMEILWRIVRRREEPTWAVHLVDRAREAIEQGLKCILQTQILQGTRRTGWAQHYDSETLVPVPGRSFEPAALASHETVGVIKLLQRINEEAPDRYPGLEPAGNNGLEWLWGARFPGLVSLSGKLLHDPGAGDLWGRFYFHKLGVVFGLADGTTTFNYEDLPLKDAPGARTLYGWWVTSPRQLFEESEK
jgi:PelA/Pel-15E family pectate lyase